MLSTPSLGLALRPALFCGIIYMDPESQSPAEGGVTINALGTADVSDNLE